MSYISILIIFFTEYVVLTLTIIIQNAVLAAALNARGMWAPMAGCRRAASPQRSVWGLNWGPEAVRLNSGSVRAAVAGGGGVAGQAFVMGYTTCTAATGPRTFVQVIHVQFESIADVRLPILLLLWNKPHIDTFNVDIFLKSLEQNSNAFGNFKLNQNLKIWGSILVEN